MANRARNASESVAIDLNVSKIKIMKIITKKTSQEPQDMLDGKAVETAKEFRFLGVFFTDINSDSRGIRRRIAMAKKTRLSKHHLERQSQSNGNRKEPSKVMRHSHINSHSKPKSQRT